jgi:hypothetical protein
MQSIQNQLNQAFNPFSVILFLKFKVCVGFLFKVADSLAITNRDSQPFGDSEPVFTLKTDIGFID